MEPQPDPSGPVEFCDASASGGMDPRGIDPHCIDPHWAELSALVSRAEQNRIDMARLQAQRAELFAEALQLVALRVAQRRAAKGNREFGDTIPLREVIAELACALRVGERTIASWLGDGDALVRTYPATLEALREGRIDERHASAIIDGGMPLDDAHRGQYEELVLPLAETATAPELRESARVIAARLQPEMVEERQRAALAQRQVKTYGLEDGLSRLLLDGPDALIQAAFERLTDMARALDGEGPVAFDADDDVEDGAADAGSADPDADTCGDREGDADGGGDRDGECEPADERTLDQRRADIMLDMLLCGAPAAHGEEGALGAIRATVQVTIPILTLAGIDDQPAILAGCGPIDADTARTLAASAPCWERVMVHPVTEEPLRLDTYRPSKKLRRLLDARDRQCRWPGCRRLARRSEADHTIPFSEGGPTCAGNLAILCKRHHRLKHASPWQVVQLGAGVLEFISPTRRRYRNNAPPVDEARTARPWARLLATPYDSTDPAAF